MDWLSGSLKFLPTKTRYAHMFKEGRYIYVLIYIGIAITLTYFASRYIIQNMDISYCIVLIALNLLFVIMPMYHGRDLHKDENKKELQDIFDKNRERAIEEGRRECYGLARALILDISTFVLTSMEITREDMSKGLPRGCHGEIHNILEQLVSDGYLEKRGIRYLLIKSSLMGFIDSSPYDNTGGPY